MRSNLSKLTVLSAMVLFILALQACASAVIQPTTSPVSPTLDNSTLNPNRPTLSPLLASPVSPTLDNSTQAPSIDPSPFVETPVCIEKMALPIITDIQPSPVLSGSEITITGSGGYVQDSCGLINESARSFKLYLDNEPVGDLLCYVNHCQTKINLAGSIAPNSHCLSTQVDICEFRFEVGSE